jgi:O-acetyl-ADP-ribose deacetylase (regulator of RNase III)
VITVIVDDLAFLAVDAVLRPADESLAPLTPEGTRLDRMAGARFAEQRKVASPLEAGAAVVTGGGDLAAPYVLHLVIRDPVSPVGRSTVRRALVSAWQRAGDWGLHRLAAPLVGAGPGQLGPEEAAALLVETFPRGGPGEHPAELAIVVEREAERDLVEAILRRHA